MRRVSSAILIVLLLSLASPLVSADSKGIIGCTSADLDMMPASWEIADQSCVTIDFQEVLTPGTTFSFDIESDEEIDILLFTSNARTTYQNEQNYRTDLIWEEDSVFESFSGQGSWHWTVPDEGQSTRWYMVIDNLAHPQDNGQGAQGGSVANVVMNVEQVVSPAFSLIDTIVRLDTNDHEVVAGPFYLDQGSQLSVSVTTMEGGPDIFLMTEEQKNTYESAVANGTVAASRINQADLLAVTSSGSTVWSADSQYSGVPLYLLVDNRAGAGGAGTSKVATTVVSYLTPVVEVTLTDPDSLTIIDVGVTITLDASNTPNLSNQISSINWDTDGDGFDDYSGETIEVSWLVPTNFTLKVTAVSTDSRSSTIFKNIEVRDISNPSASIDINSDITRGYGENIVLSGQYSDNWEVSTVEWLVDDLVVESYSGDDSSATSFTHVFDSSYISGLHTITLRVTDKSGLVTDDVASINLYDPTPPRVDSDFVSELQVVVNQAYPFSVPATDPESTNLIYKWDFDRDVDSDNDGISSNDNEGVGPTVVHPFSEPGIFWVVCTIQNDEGLTTEAEILVTVISADPGSDGIDWLNIIVILVVILVVMALIGLVTVRVLENRKIAAMLAEQEEKEVEENVAPPSVEEQKAMWGGAGINQVTPLSQPNVGTQYNDYSSGMSGLPTPPPSGTPTTPVEMDPELSELLSDSPPPTSAPINTPANDLLAAFEEDDAVPREDIQHDFDSSENSENVWKPSEDPLEGISAPVSEIVEAPDSEPELEPEQEPEPEIKVEHSSENRSIRKSCSSCEKLFEVDMPVGVDVARTSCPHCGSIETIRFE
ncbi:MAG: hypothetical protein QGG22_04235 [Candidatus Thalassarchaeaceae archaeon]|nr:hypothetical protein [Candidatus Thalassarchaeaceae archaeon]